MFETQNSIEPVGSMASKAAPRVEPLIREATPGDLAAASRRTRSSAADDTSPVQAVPEPRGSFFRRRQAEPDKPDAVAQQHGLYTAEKGSTRRYYADYQQKQEVMRADTKRISTKLDDKQTVSAVLDLAQSRGWDTVRVKGTADFQREAWVQAQVRGMKAEGYRPTATDQQEAARRKAAAAPIQVQPAIERPAEKVAAATPAKAPNARRVAVASPEPAKPKMAAAQRSKAVWGSVEQAGQQARASDPATAKAVAAERPGGASVP